MEDQRWEPGMPLLDRQAAARRNLPPSLAALPPRSVPEVAPTPLQRQFVSLSVAALIAGAVAITALELGTPLASPLIKVCAIIAAPILLLTTGDAAVRIWRSAWAWMPVNRSRALFRLSWLVVALLFIAIVAAAAAVVLTS
jgi:hypothetical protein